MTRQELLRELLERGVSTITITYILDGVEVLLKVENGAESSIFSCVSQKPISDYVLLNQCLGYVTSLDFNVNTKN